LYSPRVRKVAVAAVLVAVAVALAVAGCEVPDVEATATADAPAKELGSAALAFATTALEKAAGPSALTAPATAAE